MREALSRRNLPSASLDIMLASLSDNSMKQYDSCLKKWWTYCKVHSVDFYGASIPDVIDFLTKSFETGCQYGTLNSYRSALSMILGPNISKDDGMQRFFKGVFRLRPPVPKYSVTWDTNVVLDYLCALDINEELSLENISKKCVTLLALTIAHRVQNFSKIQLKTYRY